MTRDVKARLIAAGGLFLFGMGAIIVGVAFIYWPAALILGGAGVAFLGWWWIDIPSEEPSSDRPTSEFQPSFPPAQNNEAPTVAPKRKKRSRA